MTEEDNFKNLCSLTTRVLGLPKGSLALKGRKQPLQIARAITGYIARKEEGIHRTIIGKGLNRKRSLIYYYEKSHKKSYANSLIYRDVFYKIYKAYKDVSGTKKFFLDGDKMRVYLLKNGVSAVYGGDVSLKVTSGQVKCIIKTSYLDVPNQLENIKLALKDYHITIKII